MDTHAFWNWYYLIFLVPGGVAIFLLLLSSVLSLGGSDSGDDGSAEGDTGDAEVDADAEAESDADGESGSGTGVSLLGFLGVGKAPLTLVLGGLLLGWSFTGFWAVQLLLSWLKAPGAFVGPAIGIALVGSILLARTTAATAARFVPKIETAAVSREALVGREARVVYPITETGGRAFCYDQRAVLHDVSCRVRHGEATIARGVKIILAGYHPPTGRFWAEVSPFQED